MPTSWRKTRDYRIWRAHVIRRDKRCMICGSIHVRHAHHINHATYFPELRFDEDNGVCLCSKCHMQFHCNFMRSYRQKCDTGDFCNFITFVIYIREIENRSCISFLNKETERLENQDALLSELDNLMKTAFRSQSNVHFRWRT